MTKIEEPQKRLGFDPDKCSRLYEELVEVYRKHKPTAGEIIITYGNLGYTLGASIGGYEGKGPSVEELKKLHYSNPTLEVGLMLTALNMMEWYDEWEIQQIKKIKE